MRELMLIMGACWLCCVCAAQPLAGTAALEREGDFAMEMVEGIRKYLERELEAAPARRTERWAAGSSLSDDVETLLKVRRSKLAQIIGAQDVRQSWMELEFVATSTRPSLAFENERIEVHHVRWPVLEGVHGEGLLLKPKGEVHAAVVAIPDTDWEPEYLVGVPPYETIAPNTARRLAESGCVVLVPALIDRQVADSSNWRLGIQTNQPHREFIYRAAYELGRHLIGIEVQKVLAGIDWLQSQGHTRIGIFGYGEGGLIALHAAALDTSISATVVSGYFAPRERMWSEPIYRNVWSALEFFGNAELAVMAGAPERSVIVEASKHPEVSLPYQYEEKRNTAAPGALSTPEVALVEQEFRRSEELAALLRIPFQGILIGSGSSEPGSEETLEVFLDKLHGGSLASVLEMERDPRSHVGDPSVLREQRQVEELIEWTQRLLREAPAKREEFWKNADRSSAEKWKETAEAYRQYFHLEVIGGLPDLKLPPNARTRQFIDTDKYTGYQVLMDVYEDVPAYGLLLVPKGMGEGERRPVLVCQHGLEGRPEDVADPRVDNQYYHQYGCKLAEEGFVVYAPQNPYIGEDKFRVLQRMANPLGLSLFSFIVRQHEQTLNWLETLPFVDGERMAFYGLSYGGKTAMRVPAILEKYCLSICSADYNEWIWKNARVDSPYSYLYTGEYEMPEFDLGNTFNYAEMSWLIFPRPFMVERGHNDGVAPDEWVAYEYARTKRHYVQMGMGEKTEIEYFDGPHEIHGVGTFAFLRKHLNFPN